MRSRLIVVLVAAVALFGAYTVLSFPANHDIAWTLFVAGKVLQGVPLYEGIVELNPPLIIWLSAVPEWIARTLGAWNVLLYRLLTLGVAVLSILLSRAQLEKLDAETDAATTDSATLLLAYLFIARPGFEFGQREHLAIMLVLPFLIMLARQSAGVVIVKPQGAALGLVAGIGFAIKPHFLLAWLAVSVYVAARRGWRVLLTPAQLALTSVLALYGASILVFERDYFALARMAAGAYDHFGQRSLADMLTAPVPIVTILAIAVSLFLPKAAVVRDLRNTIAIAALAFVAVVLVQEKGWDYHWIPATTLAVLLLPIALRAWLPRMPAWAPAVVGVALIALTFTKLSEAEERRARMQAHPYYLGRMISVVEQLAGDRPIAALSSNMGAAFPLVNYTDADWALRLNSLWLLPGLYPPEERTYPMKYHALDEMSETERYMFNSVVEDLTTKQPALLYVESLPTGNPEHKFNFLTYFGRDARFENFMRSYREVARMDRYRIYARTE